MTATNNYVASILAGDTHASGRLFLTSNSGSEFHELPELDAMEVRLSAIDAIDAIDSNGSNRDLKVT